MAKSELLKAAEEVYEVHRFSEEGVTALEQRIRNTPTLLELAIHQAAYDTLRMSMRDTRHKISTPPGGTQRHYSREEQEAIVDAVKGFYSRPLMDGTLLRDATGEVLLRDAERYEAQASGCAREAKFLRLVAAKVSPGQKVGDVWTEDELEKLFQKAKKKGERKSRVS